VRADRSQVLRLAFEIIATLALAIATFGIHSQHAKNCSNPA
jgi:hypothetical protein